MPITEDLKKLDSTLDDATQKLFYAGASTKQKEIIDTVRENFPTLEVTSTTRENAPKSSGHSTFQKKAVDFRSDNLQDLFYAFEGLQKLKPSYTVALGIDNAAKHLHVSNDNRHLRFLEIERPDKNGFVKVITFFDKNYESYLTKARRQYKVDDDVSSKIKNISDNALGFLALGVGFFFLVSRKRKR